MPSTTTVYPKTSSVRVSTVLLALVVGITVVGLPVSVWLLLVALGTATLDDTAIRVSPLGGTMRWSDVARFGVGFKTGQLDRGQGTPLRTRSVHLLLQDASGRQVTVHTTNYARSRALLDDIKRRVGRAPERLEVSFLLQRLSFAED